LIEGLSDAHQPRNRARAAAALPDIPKPTVETLDALSETAHNASSASPEDTRLVRNSATYAIGTLEQRTRSANPELAGQALSELRSTLSSAHGDQQQAAVLDAIGNSGNATLLSDIKPLLEASEGLVRSHAIQAMGHMDPTVNQDMFKGLIAHEPDAQIRGTIAVTYADQAKRANQPPPNLVVDAAIEQLTQEPDPRVRGLLIELIGPACVGYSNALQALATAFQRETDPILLRLIGKWVPGDRLGQ
jgi:HEAT repeat protein